MFYDSIKFPSNRLVRTILADPLNCTVTPVDINAVFTRLELLQYFNRGLNPTGQFVWHRNLQDEVVEALRVYREITLTTPHPNIFNNLPSFITPEDLHKEGIKGVEQEWLRLEKK